MALLPVALLFAALATTGEPAAPLPTLTGWLEAHERGGCGGGDVDETLRTRFEGSQAILEQDVWLSSRESLEPMNAVDVVRDGDLLSAEVDVQVQPIEEDRPVPACIRAVHIVLRVDGLPAGDYRLQLRKAQP